MKSPANHIERIAVEPGVKLAVEVPPPSNKPVMVLSNSIGATMSMWDDIVARLTERWRLVRYDTRGHGQSDVPAGPYTIDRLGLDAVAILDVLEIPRATFCGLSLGGLMGQWLGAIRGERLTGLVLANTAPNFPPPSLWLERAAAVRAHGMAPMIVPTLDRWLTRSFRELHPERTEQLGKMIAAISPEGYAACCEVLAVADLKPRLPDIGCPVLVICGANDPSTPPSRGEEIAAGVPGARMVTLDAAHISAIEASGAFAEELLQFAVRTVGPA
ncbi:3-oxoadipate enol-lactonase [Bradyrhizobium sp. B097]|uniref:3-oxoadipate enol-lactonase n=1 Tax=Bradyrhizobium sp. B097 TaxID=3140244 RepID=UPI00318355E5